MKTVHLVAMLAALASSLIAASSASAPPTPGLKFLARLEVRLGPLASTGATSEGERRIIPIVGGTVSGPRLQGEILGVGADWQWVRPDGTAVLDAQYAFRTSDGAIVMVHNRGLRYLPDSAKAVLPPGEPVPPHVLYFRATPRFETGDPRYAWLNRVIAVCSGIRLPDRVVLDFYEVQ